MRLCISVQQFRPQLEAVYSLTSSRCRSELCLYKQNPLPVSIHALILFWMHVTFLFQPTNKIYQQLRDIKITYRKVSEKVFKIKSRK